jgi:hypothetical protein
MQRPGDPRPAQREDVDVLSPQRHQTRHLVLCQPDLMTTEISQTQIGDSEINASAAL